MAAQWAGLLQGHPDKQFSQYMLPGIVNDFRVGFDYAEAECYTAQSNLLSVDTNLVSRYLQEVSVGQVVGPLPPGIHISPIGAIPKGHKPGKWRLIGDLSSPAGKSVNNGISPELCSLTYMDDAARVVASQGRGALLAKMDVKSAYRMAPVNPQDRHLLGMKWQGMVYVDTNKAPLWAKIGNQDFTAVADALEWCFQNWVVQHAYHCTTWMTTSLSAGWAHRNASATWQSCWRPAKSWVFLLPQRSVRARQHVLHTWVLRWIPGPWNCACLLRSYRGSGHQSRNGWVRRRVGAGIWNSSLAYFNMRQRWCAQAGSLYAVSYS